jgi:hypothetical protein
LARFFPDTFEIHTVVQMGWAGSKNGVLLELASRQSFHALITADQGIAYQQNLDSLPLTVIVMIASRTRLQELRALVPRVVDLLGNQTSIGVYRVAV